MTPLHSTPSFVNTEVTAPILSAFPTLLITVFNQYGESVTNECHRDEMTLDFDVLLSMMKWIEDSNTLSRFTRTCRAIRDKGIVRLLAQFPLRLCGKNALSFRQLMLADPDRYRHLRAIQIEDFHYIEHKRKATIRIMMKILKRATNLTKLDVGAEVLKTGIIHAVASSS